jgi:multiple sugar transport system permease protein
MFSTKVGVVNNFLTGFGIISNNIEWLTDQKMAMVSVIIANIWIGIPFNMILISTGLTSIPGELYESASIDGANAVQQFFRIALPLMRSTIESILVLGFIYTFKVFDLVYVMTSGGPVNATQLMSTYSYKLSFDNFLYSKGSAVANVLLVILLLVGIVYICETLSVILQVGYFKLTHGKRLFKMSPIHHHFEMCGWKEVKIVLVFSAVSAVLCLVAWFGIQGLR